MKILISDHYSEKEIMEIKAVSPEIDVAVLNINRNLGIFSRIVRVLLFWAIPYSFSKRWKHLFYDRYLQKNISVDGKSLDQEGKDVDIFLCSWIITRDILINLLPFLPNLKWIHSTPTGVHRILSPELVKSNVILTSSIGVHSVRVAEFIIALMLNVAKRIPEHLRLQREKRWQSIQAEELKGKTVGIIGYGHIGREVAKRAQAFEMKVMAIKKTYSKSGNGVIILHLRDLRDLLKICDFLIICAPLTKETESMIGEAELSTMKKEAYIISISPGIVNKKALIRALKENWIAGACLDNFIEGQLSRSSPFYFLPNVIITHHSAYASPNSHREIFGLFLINLKRFIAGRNLLCIVEKEKCY